MIVLGREYWAAIGGAIMPCRVIERTEPVEHYFVFKVEYRDSLNQRRTAKVSSGFVFPSVDAAFRYCKAQADYFDCKASRFQELIDLDEEMNAEQYERFSEEFAESCDTESQIKLSRE